MATLPARVKCDQCGTVAERPETAAWLQIQGRRTRADLISLYVGDNALADLCSWLCLIAYANTRIQAAESDGHD